MINTKHLSHKEKIILKIYVKYIVKKFSTKTKSNINIFRSNYSNSLFITNKVILESILNKKYFQINNNIQFNNFFIPSNRKLNS
jgi:hypothetical protein